MGYNRNLGKWMERTAEFEEVKEKFLALDDDIVDERRKRVITEESQFLDDWDDEARLKIMKSILAGHDGIFDRNGDLLWHEIKEE